MTMLQMNSISKYFGTFTANDNVNLIVEKGEIHSLLGENGAGKSTLMNVLYGLYKPDTGEIYFEGKKLNLKSSKDAIDVGIGMIHQHFMLIPVHTVLENIIMGMGKEKGFIIDKVKLKAEIQKISEKYGMSISLDKKVSELSVGEQQRVEIVKALYRGAKLLIMDEPTAVLTPQETDELFLTLRKMADGGMSIILITHKLREVMSICDNVTVLRDGKVTNTVCIKDTTENDLIRYMIGRELSPVSQSSECEKGDQVLRIEELTYTDDKGVKILNNINLHICSGEVLGIAGVDGNGQKELAEGIAGLLKGTEGRILLNGQEIRGKCIQEIINHGIGYIPEDRHKRGLVLDFSISENLILKDYYKKPFSNKLFFNFKEIGTHAENMIEKYSIKTNSKDKEARKLSGGNQQKIVVAREIDKHPKLLIAVQPARGVDIGATEFIHKQIVKAKEQGTAVLLISTELSEIRTLSDRIAVIYKGSIVGELDRKDYDENEIGLMMAGAKDGGNIA